MSSSNYFGDLLEWKYLRSEKRRRDRVIVLLFGIIFDYFLLERTRHHRMRGLKWKSSRRNDPIDSKSTTLAFFPSARDLCIFFFVENFLGSILHVSLCLAVPQQQNPLRRWWFLVFYLASSPQWTNSCWMIDWLTLDLCWMGRRQSENEEDAAAKAVAKSTLRQAPAQHVDAESPPAAAQASSSQQGAAASSAKTKGNDDVEDDMANAKWSAVAQAPATFAEESKEDDERRMKMRTQNDQVRSKQVKIQIMLTTTTTLSRSNSKNTSHLCLTLCLLFFWW